ARLPPAVARHVVLQLRRLAGPAGHDGAGRRARRRLRGGQLRPRRRAGGPAAAGGGVRPAGRGVRRPVRPAQAHGRLRRAAVRPVRVDPAGRHAVVAVHRDLPHRVRQPVLDPGQGGLRPQPGPAGPAGGGQPGQPGHDVRDHPRRRGPRLLPARPADRRAGGVLRLLRRQPGRPRALHQRPHLPRLRADRAQHPADQRPVRRVGRAVAERVPAGRRGLEVRRALRARARAGRRHPRRVRRRRGGDRHRQDVRGQPRRRRRGVRDALRRRLRRPRPGHGARSPGGPGPVPAAPVRAVDRVRRCLPGAGRPHAARGAQRHLRDRRRLRRRHRLPLRGDPARPGGHRRGARADVRVRAVAGPHRPDPDAGRGAVPGRAAAAADGRPRRPGLHRRRQPDPAGRGRPARHRRRHRVLPADGRPQRHAGRPGRGQCAAQGHHHAAPAVPGRHAHRVRGRRGVRQVQPGDPAGGVADRARGRGHRDARARRHRLRRPDPRHPARLPGRLADAARRGAAVRRRPGPPRGHRDPPGAGPRRRGHHRPVRRLLARLPGRRPVPVDRRHTPALPLGHRRAAARPHDPARRGPGDRPGARPRGRPRARPPGAGVAGVPPAGAAGLPVAGRRRPRPLPGRRRRPAAGRGGHADPGGRRQAAGGPDRGAVPGAVGHRHRAPAAVARPPV
ncbi:MAG: Thymidylate kinase, partial [uncultured Corynebacteriales bacterium]